ncbi:MAG: hypothetical protein WC837_14965 [Bellilinea sp.]
MEKKEIVLAGLYPSDRKIFTPVQVQKLFFLLDKNISAFIDGPVFDFQPYNYGPFDKSVYCTLEELHTDGFVEIIPFNSRSNYRLTNEGQIEAKKIFSKLDQVSRAYITNVSNFVLSLSFSELVSAIYKAYPEMRVNSVFQEN